ncbi:MAG: hypothetical protein KDK78_08305 [Chlamydiia bacterium]|nr:hypothetical protein [Chlamydiia bacterium]
MKTKIAIVITSLLFVAGLIFQSSLTQFILVRSLTAMCSSQIGAALTYEDVKAQNGRYVLHGVRIAPKEARGGSGWVLSGDQLSIGLQPRWLKGRVDIDLQLAGGRFEVPQGVVLALPKPSTEGLLLGLLRKEWRVRADDAHLALLGRNAADATETLLVNVEAMGGATQHLHLQFLSEAEGRSGTAESWMDFLPERSLLSVRCVDVDLAPLYRLSQVCGMQPGDFRVSHGRLSGAFALEKRPKGHWLPIESGSLQADKLLVGMASGQFQCQVPELALQLQPTQNAKDSCVRLECKKGASLTHYRDRQLVASVHQLQGQLDLRADYSLDARLKGLFHQGRDPRDLFLSLETEPLLAKHFAADISLRLETDGKRDFGGRLRVEQIDSTAHWEGSVQNLRAAEWNLAASYIQDNIPHLADFHIHQGGIDGEFAFKVLPSGLQSARLQSLFVRDLQGDW